MPRIFFALRKAPYRIQIRRVDVIKGTCTWRKYLRKSAASANTDSLLTHLLTITCTMFFFNTQQSAHSDASLAIPSPRQSGAFRFTALKLAIGVSVLSLSGVASGLQALSSVAAVSTRPALTQATGGPLPSEGTEALLAGQVANQGVQAFTSGNTTQALEHWQQALGLYQVAGDRAGEGRMLENLSVIHRLNNRAAESVTLIEQALALYETLGSEDQQPSLYLNLGSAYRLVARTEDAIAAFEQGLSIYQRDNDPKGERIMLSLLAQIHTDSANYPQSIALNEQALELAQRTMNRTAEAEALSELGFAHVMSEQPAQALTYFQPALSLYRQLGDRAQEVATLNNLGRAASLSENYDQALEAYQQALVIFREMDRPAQEAQLLVNIAQAYLGAGKTTAAIATFQQAVTLTESLRQQQPNATTLPPRMEAAYRNLATLLQGQSRNEEAREVLNLI